MAETITPPAAPAAPAPTQTGIAAATGNTAMSFDSVVAPPAPKEPKVEPAAPAAPTAEPVAPKEPAQPKADDGDEGEWKQAPPKWYKRYEGYKGKTQAQIKELTDKLKAAESRPQTTANDEAIARYEKQIDELRTARTDSEKRLIESDYARSQEYQDKYVKRWHKQRSNALGEVKGLRFVESVGEDGQPTYRAATEADFNDVLNMAPSRQDEYLQKHFGASALRVAQHINELNRIKSEASDAVAEHAENFQKSVTEKELASKKEKTEFESEKSKAHAALEEKWPNLFSTKHYESDLEVKKTLDEGYAFVDQSPESMAKMPVADRAALATVIRARAAATPMLHMLLERANQKTADLEAELAKYRRSDPGSVRPAPGGPQPVKEKPMGIAGAAAVFDSAVRQ